MHSAQCEPTVSCDYEIVFHDSQQSYLKWE